MPAPSARRLFAGLVTAVATAAGGAAQVADPPPSGTYRVYLGTYTGGKGGSKGIYRCELDVKTGKLTEPELAAEVGSPSFVTLRPDGKVLYAVGETAGKKGEGGGVYAYSVDATTGGLAKLDQSTSGGDGPCHVTTDPAGRMLLVANYGGGSWKLFQLAEDGRFGAAHFSQVSGTGPNKQRQEKPHAHCGAFAPDGTGMVVDLGTDQVWRFRFTRTADAIREELLESIKLPPGSGPRHVQMTPAGDWAFVCGELDCTVNVVKFAPAGGTPKVVQSLSTLPAGKPGKGDSTAEVRIHPSGKFVYVSNRGHNSIAAFKWDGAKLAPAGHATEGIKTPRNFNVDPTGRWMLVANQDGHSVAVFEVDAESGLPKPTGTVVKVGSPVCVKFLAKP